MDDTTALVMALKRIARGKTGETYDDHGRIRDRRLTWEQMRSTAREALIELGITSW